MDRILLGLLGEAGSGKDTVADWLCLHYGFTKRAIATPFKEFLKRVYGFDDEQLWGDRKEEVDRRYGVNAREVMQGIGAAFRRYHDTVWVDLLLAERLDREVVSDVRLLNEVTAIKQSGGKIWKLFCSNNPKTAKLGVAAKDRTEAEMLAVPSELIDAVLIAPFPGVALLQEQASGLVEANFRIKRTSP